MRLETIASRCQGAPAELDTPGNLQDAIRAIRSGLESALNDLRSISAGLQLPEIDDLSTDEVAGRAVRDYERKTGAKVVLVSAGDPMEVSLPVKITLYRLLQESLANSFRHAGGVDQRVALSHTGSHLIVEVRDRGPGFQASELPISGRVGMVGMRERVQALGGSFELETALGQGTVIRATLPTRVPGVDGE